MNRFSSIFKHVQCPVIGMVHVKALPGTPQYRNLTEAVEEAVHDFEIYRASGLVRRL